MSDNDPYEVLGISPAAEQEVIEAAHLALVKKYHPDHFDGDPAIGVERTQAVNAAFDAVADPARRRALDGRRDAGRGARGPRISVRRYFAAGRARDADAGYGLGTVVFVALTMLLLGWWAAAVVESW